MYVYVGVCGGGLNGWDEIYSTFETESGLFTDGNQCRFSSHANTSYQTQFLS